MKEHWPAPSKIKTEEELKGQVQQTEGVLEQKITPDESLDLLDISTIKEKYKTRYEAYVTALRALRRGALNTKEITHAKEWITALNNLDTYIKEHESQDNPLLREKQFHVFKRIRDFLDQGKRKGYIKLPAGTGKTILFSEIAEALGMRTFIVSPTTIILGQNAKEMADKTDAEFGQYYSSEKDLSKPITHITYHSLLNAVRGGKINPDEVPVLILDEAHRSLGSGRSEIIKRFEGLQLGFTATSEFSEEKKVADLLEEEIFRMDISDAIQEGLICQTQTVHAYTNTDISGIAVSGNQYNEAQLEKAINVHSRNLAAIELFKSTFSHLKVFVNCASVHHAQKVAELFNEQGIAAAYITANTKEDEREEIKKNFKSGALRVLINAEVLREGYNEPSCSVTFNLVPTLSLVVAEQRARSGRLDPHNPDKWNYVVDFIDQNEKKHSILYSEILRAARVWDISPPKKGPKGPNGPKGPMGPGPTPPIDFDDLLIEGLSVTVDTEKIMEVTKRNLDERIEIPEALEGWVTATWLMKELRYDSHTIKLFAEQYRDEHPEWFKNFKAGTHITEHYDPELVIIIRENLNRSEALHGWESSSGIAAKIRRSYDTIKNNAEQYRDEHPEWFKKFINKGKWVEYYHTDLIKKIKKNLFAHMESPHGWETSNALTKLLKGGIPIIQNVAEQYRDEHPEWFKKFAIMGKLVEHYSPELISIIREVLRPQEGWKNINQILNDLKIDRLTIQNYTKQYKDKHPEWFKTFVSILYYHPDLVSLIKKDLISEHPEKGWLNTSQMIEKGTSFSGIKNFVEQYRDKHPEWFKKFRIKGKLVEHYAPKLIDLIKKELFISSPGLGWMSISRVYSTYHISSPKIILRFVKKYRENHPEWFLKFKNGGQIVEHYSPELVKEIIEHFKNLGLIPGKQM